MSTLSSTKHRLLDSIVEVQRSPFDTDIGYTPHALVQAALPYRNSKKLSEKPFWSVENGRFSIIIQPGIDLKSKKHIGYPTGTIPRLLMFWMATEAKIKGQRRLELGGSLNEFLRKLNLSPTSGGGSKGDARRLKEQMRRLFRARLSFQYEDGKGEIEHEQWLDMQVAPKGEVMWSEMYPDCDTLFENWIELGEYFFEAITEHAVPIDMRVLKGIQNAPMALDLYNWLTYRSFAAWKSKKNKVVPWPSLHKQFGSSYGELKVFRYYARKHLKTIQQLYPALCLEEEDNTLIIKPTRPAIAQKNILSSPA